MQAGQLLAGDRGVGVDGRRQPAHQLLDRGLDVTLEEQPAVAGERIAHLVGQLSDHAEVHVADGVTRQDVEVGRVQVGVEVAVHVDLIQHVPVEVTDDRLQAVAVLFERLQIGAVAGPDGDHDVDQRDALDEVAGEYARGGVATVDARDALERIVARVLVELHGLAGLDQIVELVGRPAREFVDDLAAARLPRRSASDRGARPRCTSARCRRAWSRGYAVAGLSRRRPRRWSARRDGPARSKQTRRASSRTPETRPPAARQAPVGRSRGTSSYGNGRTSFSSLNSSSQ